MAQRHREEGRGNAPIVLAVALRPFKGLVPSGISVRDPGVFGDEMEIAFCMSLKPRRSAVQFRGPRPQFLAVRRENNQNWYSHVDISLHIKSDMLLGLQREKCKLTFAPFGPLTLASPHVFLAGTGAPCQKRFFASEPWTSGKVRREEMARWQMKELSQPRRWVSTPPSLEANVR
jgi:hypothetical protein